MDYVNKINKRIKKLGYSKLQLSRICGISDTSIKNFLDGEKIKFENFIKIVNSLEFNKNEKIKLIQEFSKFNFGEIFTPGEFTIKDSLEHERSNIRLKELEKSFEIGELQNKIPVYSSVSAGIGRIPDAEPMDWIITSEKEKNYKATVVFGNSMEPQIKDRSIVIFKEDVELLNRDIGIFILDGESYVKRIFKKNGEIILMSDNINYDPIYIHEYDDFKICGKVVKVLSDV